MTERRPERATPENWWWPPQEGWMFDQVKDLELPFDWELIDGGIVVRSLTPLWHDMVRGNLFLQLASVRRDPLAANVFIVRDGGRADCHQARCRPLR